jgi:hypothetical protein
MKSERNVAHMGCTEIYEKLYSENLQERGHLKDLSAYMRENFKLMLKNLGVRF